MNRIKEVLEQLVVRQTWLSERIGKSYNMVNGYVQNRRQPSLDNLNQITLDVKKLIVSNKKEDVND